MPKIFYPLVFCCQLLFAFGTLAQVAPVKPAPLSPQLQGTGTCSVEKSCAELAPVMIQSALGPLAALRLH